MVIRTTGAVQQYGTLIQLMYTIVADLCIKLHVEIQDDDKYEAETLGRRAGRRKSTIQ